MKSEIIKTAVNKFGTFVSKNSSSILTGFGVAGLVTTAALAGWATYRAMLDAQEENAKRMEEYEKELEKAQEFDSDTEEIGPELIEGKELVRYYWKYYIPAGVMGLISCGCIIGADRMNLKQKAALASLYSISESRFKEYKEKVIDTLGKGKEQNLVDAIQKERIDQNPPKDNQIIITGKGTVKCFDAFSGRYFWSDIENIRRVQNDLNQALISDMWISLNDVYYALGLKGIKLGDEMGWNVDNLIDFDFSSQLDTDGTPVLVMDYRVGPRHDFRNLM